MIGLLFFILVLTLLWILWQRSYFARIKARTIHMQAPVSNTSGEVMRFPAKMTKKHLHLAALESLSRKSAYKTTSIKTDSSFFDDSDLSSPYFLVVIYDKRKNSPLLTARYYYSQQLIEKCLKGDEKQALEGALSFNLHQFKEEEIFLSDRLSGNTSSALYRRHRNYIFMLFYWQILVHNRNKHFILMARKEKYEKLLAKYLRLGLDIAGSTRHKGKEHWILLGDTEKSFKQLKGSFLLNLFFLAKSALPNINHP